MQAYGHVVCLSGLVESTATNLPPKSERRRAVDQHPASRKRECASNPLPMRARRHSSAAVDREQPQCGGVKWRRRDTVQRQHRHIEQRQGRGYRYQNGQRASTAATSRKIAPEATIARLRENRPGKTGRRRHPITGCRTGPTHVADRSDPRSERIAKPSNNSESGRRRQYRATFSCRSFHTCWRTRRSWFSRRICLTQYMYVNLHIMKVDIPICN